MGISKSKNTNILFIGNSFTFYNDMPNILEKLGSVNGFDVHVEHVTHGGYSLVQFINEAEVALELSEKLDERHWNFVILQEHSRKPLDNKTEFLSSIKSLNEMIRKQAGKTILYSTWSYRDHSSKLKSTGLTYNEFYSLLKNRYEEAGALIDAVVAPVGTVFHKITKDDSKIDLLVEDDSHPNIKGSFIAAFMFYSIIFGENNSNYLPDGINEIDGNMLRKVVLNIIKQP